MTVLLTRPFEDSEKMAERLSEKGMDSFIEPMFHVKHLNIDWNDIDYSQKQGTIFTSRHAVRKIPKLLSLPCFVVGQSTAQEAKNLGFSDVRVAEGNLDSLLNILSNLYGEAGGDFLYLHGSKVTLDLSAYFKTTKINVDSIIVYETEENKKLSSMLAKKILVDEIKTAIFFSENTVTIFIKRAEEASLLNKLESIQYFAISNKVKRALQNKGLRNVVEFNGDINNLIDLIGQYKKRARK